MMKTLVITSHTYLHQSRIIKHIENAIKHLENVEVRNLEKIYGHNSAAFDIAKEKEVYKGVDRVVFLFPIHWFNITPMIKSYLNEVWTYGWAFGPDGHALKNKEMLIISSAGASQYTYSKQGIIESNIEEIFTPMKASALYVGMKYTSSIVLYDAMNKTDDELSLFTDQVIQILK